MSLTLVTVVEKLPDLPLTAGKVTGRRKALVRLREADEEQSKVIKARLMAMGFAPERIKVRLADQHKSITAQLADEVREGRLWHRGLGRHQPGRRPQHDVRRDLRRGAAKPHWRGGLRSQVRVLLLLKFYFGLIGPV